MAQPKETLHKPNGKDPQIVIRPGITHDQLAEDIAPYIGLPPLLYNGEAEPWLVEPSDETMIPRMMTGEYPFMRNIIAYDTAQKVIDKIDKNENKSARLIFTEHSHTENH